MNRGTTGDCFGIYIDDTTARISWTQTQPFTDWWNTTFTVNPQGKVETYVLTSNGWEEFQNTKESNMRKLYEVFLVNRVDGEVKDYLELATSEADAIMLAVLEAGIVKGSLGNWVKKARFVCDVPETDG